MSKYCQRNGHAAPVGTKDGGSFICMNCGADYQNPLTVAIIDRPGHADVMEATAGLEEALTRATHVFVGADGKETDLKHMGEGKPGTKPCNPKDAIGFTKVPMHLVPTVVGRTAALAFSEGALKYGKYNWRVAGVRMSIYLDAIHRHLSKLQDGEWSDGENLTQEELDAGAIATLVPHLGSIIACCGIILDAHEVGKLTDDRPPANVYAGADFEKRIQHIAYLRELFKTYAPHQNVITDESPKG